MMKMISKNWINCVLGDISLIISGQSPESSAYNKNMDGLPFFQGKAEFGEVYPAVRQWCNAPRKIAEKDDILISVRAPAGPTNIANQKCAIGRGLAAIRANKNISRQFLFNYLRFVESDIAR
jgi:type I restriction enzyme S subunit